MVGRGFNGKRTFWEIFTPTTRCSPQRVQAQVFFNDVVPRTPPKRLASQ